MTSEVNKAILSCLIVLLVFVHACRKSPTMDQLQGTWIEQGGHKSKLIFSGDRFYFFHSAGTDSSSYTLDEKHLTLWTVPLTGPTTGGRSYQLDYHKKKGILTVIGLFPVALGQSSKNYYKKQ